MQIGVRDRRCRQCTVRAKSGGDSVGAHSSTPELWCLVDSQLQESSTDASFGQSLGLCGPQISNGHQAQQHCVWICRHIPQTLLIHPGVQYTGTIASLQNQTVRF